jgi:hypothetical protein
MEWRRRWKKKRKEHLEMGPKRRRCVMVYNGEVVTWMKELLRYNKWIYCH